jgi:hypothetical protein
LEESVMTPEIDARSFCANRHRAAARRPRIALTGVIFLSIEER